MERQVSKSATLRDLRDLRAFCLLVDLGSMTAAAKTLGETKGSVSRRLARLERELGVTLVRRSPRMVRATENGIAFRTQVQQALDMLTEATLAVQQSGAAPSGRLRVTAPHGTGVCLLAPLIARFVDRFPDIRVEMVLTEQALDFDTHQIDVAIRPAVSLRDSSLIVHKLLDYQMRLVAAPGYLQRYGTPLTPSDLNHHHMLLLGGPGPSAAGRATMTVRSAGSGSEAAARRVTVQGGIFTSDNAFIREAALAGGGIAFLPTILVDRDIQERRLVAILSAYKFREPGSVYLFYPAMRFVPPKIQVFRDFMIEALAARKNPRGRAAATGPAPAADHAGSAGTAAKRPVAGLLGSRGRRP